MKLKRFFVSVVTLVVLLLTTVVSPMAATQTATVEMEVVSEATLSNNTQYTVYNATGSVCADTAKSYVFEFNPKDGNIPLAYTGTAGGVTYMKNHIDYAIADGYEVVGAINGSFFHGAMSTMTGMCIFDGRVIIADSGAMEALACFDANGVMSHANNPSVKYPVTLDGVKNGSVVSINKKYAYIKDKATTAGNVGEFFYYDRYALNCKSAMSRSDISGFEILCEKLNNTEIAIGRTLKGKVISVTETNMGKTIPETDDKFVLFVKSDSKYVDAVKALKEGSIVEVGAEAQGYVTELESAYSAISSSYWLVKDGVDQTNTQSTIVHSVTLERAWTAFGVKEDGTYVYFVNEEMGLSLKDVAGAMIQMGCKYVIRLDGGGSSAVYNEKDGIVYLAELPEYGGRQVCDTLLIVKKSSITDDQLKAQLESALNVAKSLEVKDPQFISAINYAEKVLENDMPAKGDLKKALSGLDLNGVLQNLVTEGEKANKSHYAEADYSILETAINNAKTVLTKSNPTAEEFKEAISNLSSGLALSKYQVISNGASYEVTEGKNYSYWADIKLMHDDGVRLTDGLKSSGKVLSKDYSAWKKDATNTVTVIVDLGENKQSNSYTVYTANGFWGVANCKDLKIEGSDDKVNFKEIGVSQEVADLGNGEMVESNQSTLHTLTLKSDYVYNYRYIKFTLTMDGGFVWVDELEVACDGTLAMKTPEGEASTPEDNSQEDVSQSENQGAENQTSVEENSQQQEENNGGNTVVIISVIAGLIVGAVVVFLVAKKKK